MAYFIVSACFNEQVIGGRRGVASAAQATCPNPQHPDLDYNCPLGPTYLIPGLTDLNGWTKESQYRNILLGDLDGDGVDELVARGAAGIQVYRFDRPRGQWTQVQSRTSPTNKTTILSDAVIGTDAEHRKYWDTIRLGDIDGDGKDELVVRLSTGVVVFRFTPFPVKQDGTWDSGIWEQVTASGPMADTDAFAHGGHWGDDPSNYSTIRLAPIGRQGAKPIMQLVGRGRDGVELFRWNGSGWTQLTTLPDLSSAEGFDAPEYYTTILIFADVPPPPLEDLLLVRGPSGMRAYEFNASSGTWRLLASDGPFADASGWNRPEYYSTIQLFGGRGFPVFAGRGPNGVEVGGLVRGEWLTFEPPDHVRPLSDADGFAQPQYYRTIQSADIDGDGLDELLARRAGGMVIYRQDPGSDKWSGPISADEPALADDPWAKDASYYTAIKTARLDPNSPARSLLARGPHGIRTWRFDTGASTWTRYVPYGNFPAVDATAFAALNAFLGIQSGTIRTVYTGPSDPTSNQLASFQNEISDRCTGEITASPPQFQSCTPPPIAPGVSPAAWTAVSNQIIAELFWAQQVVDHFQTIHDMQTTLFIDEINQNTALVEDLKLVQQENVIAQVDYLALFESILYILTNLPIPGVETVFDVTAGALGIADAATLHGSEPSQFDRTIAQVQDEMTTLQQEMQDAVTAHRHYVLGDYGLLSTVGHLVGSQIWTLDTQAALSAGRQGFAVWLYEQFLPALWDRWTVLNCGNFGFLRFCHAPLDPDSPTELEALAMLEFSPTTSPGADDPAVGSGIWDGLVPKQTGACGDGCRWETLEGQHYGDVLTTLRGSVTPACTFNPAGTSWEYGCNLGVSAAELSSWSFRHVQCDYSRPDPDDAGLECLQAQPTELAGGDVRVIGTPWGHVDLSIQVPLEGKTLDLREGKVTLGRLVHEGGAGGALELVNEASGQDLTPRTLTLTDGAVGHALFSTPPGEFPSILGALTVHEGKLLISMRITGASLDSPQLCGADSTTHLSIHLIVEDAGNQPIQTLTLAPYQCRTDGNGVVRRLTFRPAAALAPIP